MKGRSDETVDDPMFPATDYVEISIEELEQRTILSFSVIGGKKVLVSLAYHTYYGYEAIYIKLDQIVHPFHLLHDFSKSIAKDLPSLFTLKSTTINM